MDAKRVIGRKFEEVSVQDTKHWQFKVINEGGIPKYQVDYKGKPKSVLPEEISSAVLCNLKETAERFLGRSVTDAVIAIPAYFTNTQRIATKNAAAIAKLNVLEIINEPTSAALAYEFGNIGGDNNKRNILVYDLGGGTFDVSIMTIEDGIFEVIRYDGDPHLGGDDFDNRMVDHFVEVFEKLHAKDLTSNKTGITRMRIECEKAKRDLSSVCEYIELRFLTSLIPSITRSRFNQINRDLFKLTLISEVAKFETHTQTQT